jgi:UDP-N-acetylmuramyl tripeptide synthase
LAAVATARLCRAAVRRIVRRGGSALPGLVAATLDPDLLYALIGELGGGTILVSGTNGKTTVTGLVAEIAKDSGDPVVSNPSGSNLARGLLSHLLEQVDLRGRAVWPRDSIGVLELDEAQLIASLGRIGPRVVVLTNLFRDQLDRYGELDALGRGFAASLASCEPRPVLVVNRDDPVLAHIAESYPGRVVGFGLDVAESAAEPDEWADSTLCPECLGPLQYSGVAYSHLGRFQCPECGFAHRPPDISGKVLRADLAGVSLQCRVDGHTVIVDSPLPGTFNAYNLLAGMAAAHALSYPVERSASVIATAGPRFGRAERIELDGVEITLLLMKNPTGANELVRTLPHDGFDLLALLNDRPADGEDVSWIWDVNFSAMGPRKLVTGGSRAADMALRLKYAGHNVAAVAEGPVESALGAALEFGGRRLLVLSTYTAMLELRRWLLRSGAVGQHWQAR